MRLGFLVLVLAVLGCERRPAIDAGVSPLAPEIPWQPHGFRAPTLKCELVVAAGLKQINPMPDHLAELMSLELPPKVSIIVSERVEETLTAAVERVRAFHQPKVVTEEAIDGGTLISVRRENDQLELVALLAAPGLPIVEVVGRFGDEAGRAQVLAVVTSLRCFRK